jgi:hypothetical protein
MCYIAVDFWCSSNWRIELDPQGCPVWRYDYSASNCPDAFGIHVDAPGAVDGFDNGG